MVSLVEHHVSPPTIEWYYDREYDAIVVTTTIKGYTVLHLGHLDATAAPLASSPTDPPEFLQPPPASPEYKPMPVYEPMPEFEPMSPGLAFLEPIVPQVPIIENR